MNHLQSFIAKATILSLVVGLVVSVAPAQAASFSTVSDTMTRLAVSTTADHSIVFTLPGSVDFDSTGNTDVLRVDFPAGFTVAGTWVTGDFTFNDGTPRTINAVAQGAGTVDCTVAAGVDNVCVAIDTTNNIFSIKPSSSYTASAAAATVTFTIDGTTTDGTVTNPGSPGSSSVALAQCDEAANCTTFGTTSHTASYAVGIVDSDQVTITATVDPSLTFDIDTATSDTNSGAAYSVALGTLSSGTLTTSNQSSINSIFIDLDTNADGGAVVTVAGANTGLNSASTSTTITLGSAEETIAAGSQEIGLCVESVSAGTGTLASGTQYDSGGNPANCTTANGGTPTVGRIETTATQIFNTAGGPIATGRGEILVKASISGVTPAATDYTNTLTLIATGTF